MRFGVLQIHQIHGPKTPPNPRPQASIEIFVGVYRKFSDIHPYIVQKYCSEDVQMPSAFLGAPGGCIFRQLVHHTDVVSGRQIVCFLSHTWYLMAILVEGDGCSEDRLRMAVNRWPVFEAAVGLHLTPYDLVGVYILALAAAQGR